MNPYFLKKEMRADCIEKRKSISEEQKKIMDSKIYNSLISLNVYKEAREVLTYVSVNSEASTKKIINTAIADGKKVAVPLCSDVSCTIAFYYIESLDELKTGSYNIPEPDAEKSLMAGGLESSICIVPALSFDRHGNRLGYGKGFYDRFLSSYSGKTIGICYSDMLSDQVPMGRYDLPVDFVVTDREIIDISK